MNRIVGLALLIITNSVWAKGGDDQSHPTVDFSKGKMTSPFAACKKALIVSKSEYEKNKSEWDALEKKCGVKFQYAAEGIIDPLKEAPGYLYFAQKVARKVAENLDKSKAYADCTASCFSGAVTCSPGVDKKNILCSERKNQVLTSMKVNARKLRMELALSNDFSGIVSVNVRNVLSVDREKMINDDLRDFEIVTPNPVGRSKLTERELKEAKRRSQRERQKLENEFKEKGYKNYADWMSVKLMEKFDEHRQNYRTLVYQEAPVFGVIERPIKINDGEPIWSDEQLARAFKKLSSNAAETKDKVNASIAQSRLEFSRLTGDALKSWITKQNDLLFYIGMKNQVEEILKTDPGSCGIATSMDMRLRSKQAQNAGMSFAAAVVAGGVGGKVLRMGAEAAFNIGAALSASEATGLIGLGMGGVFLGDSIAQYSQMSREAATLSGLDKTQEGSNLRTAEEVGSTLEGVKMSLLFAPLDVAGGWGAGKTLYSALGNRMAKDLPSIASLVKKAEIETKSRDLLVDKWLSEKMKTAFTSGTLGESDKLALENKSANIVFNALISEIEIKNPNFLKNPVNIDFILKTVATTMRKGKDDPSDLGEKAKLIMMNFNADAMSGNWGDKGQQGLLKVFSNTIEELRLSAKNDPATYVKFNTDRASQEKIYLAALKRSGASEQDMKASYQCIMH